MQGRRPYGTIRIVIVIIALAWAGPRVTEAGLGHSLRTAPSLVGLNGLANERYQNAADALLENGVRNLPVHPAGGAAYTYQYDPSCGCYTQVPAAAGPWFLTYRAEPVGAGLTT